MSERLHASITAGVCLPGFIPRLAIALLGSCAALLLVPPPFSYLGAVLAIVGALFPASLGAWGCTLVVGLAQLARTPDAGDWHPYAALAAVHLLHVLGSLSIVVEPGGVLQARTLVQPFRRWLAIQVPAQAVLAVALLLSSTGTASGSHTQGPFALGPLAPGLFALLAAACVATIVVLIIRRR